MLAPMDLILILTLIFGVGALAANVATRRAAERAAVRVEKSPAQASEAEAPGIRAPAVQETLAAAAVPETPTPAEPTAAPPVEIPVRAPAERRKHPRIQSDQTFTVTPFAGRAMMAQCSDVSEGGMRFGVVGCTLRAGDLVRVTFNIGSETVEAIGSVLRVQALDPITSDVSLGFVRVDPWAAELLAQALQADA